MTEEPPALKRKGRAAVARLRDYGGSGGGGGGGGGRNLWGKDWRRNLMERTRTNALSITLDSLASSFKSRFGFGETGVKQATMTWQL
jgi:hypothetical protein